MTDRDISDELQQQVAQAVGNRTALNIHGSHSKSFLGNTPAGTPLDTRAHRGIVNYEPTELVITARSGTTLQDVETLLAAHQQMLAFEPPRFGDHATLGGTVACNLSGPRRACAGAARDHVLGTRIINGKAEQLHFGGEVMKNVAGYDVSRLMAGAMGTLGVLLEVSLKVLPRPAKEITLRHEAAPQQALQRMHAWGQQALPLSATAYNGNSLYLRLSGATRAVDAAVRTLGGETVAEADLFWQQLREQRHAFFHKNKPLWRLSLAATTPPLALAGDWFYEWGGAQRWLLSDLPAERIRDAAAKAGGHATLYRGGDRHAGAFQPLPAGVLQLHRRLKAALDPQGIFNPGRLYPDL